jgi:hypothetical protein
MKTRKSLRRKVCDIAILSLRHAEKDVGRGAHLIGHLDRILMAFYALATPRCIEACSCALSTTTRQSKLLD